MKKEKSRHYTKKKNKKLTSSHSTISIGERDAKMLKHLSSLGKGILNIKEYSRINKIPRSSVYEILNRLERKDFVIRKEFDNRITRKGEVYLKATNRGVGKPRRECRDSKNLSTHYHTFTLPIKDKSKFRLKKLDSIENNGWKENKLANLHQVIVDFQDAKVIINPKEVRINLFEIVSENVEDSDMESLSRVIEYTEIIKNLGIETEGVMVERGHWARVESVLSKFLRKIDKKYFLKLSDGSKFWIDNSDGHLEDETNNKVVRERVDNFLNQITSDDFDLSDINKIKESLGFITKLESARLMDNIEENKLRRLELTKVNIQKVDIDTTVNYIG